VKNGLLKSRIVFVQKCFWYNESLLFEETNKASWSADHWTEHCASGFILYFKDFLTVGQRISPSGIFQRKSIRMKIHCGRCGCLECGLVPFHSLICSMRELSCAGLLLGTLRMLLVLCLDIATQPWIFSFVGALRNDQSYAWVL